MGAFCGVCCGRNSGQNDEFKKGGEKDISNGPVKNRGCTDIPCLMIYIGFWVFFIIVTFKGFSDGNPQKLWKPRDFKGDYCGIETQWNDGMNLANQPQRTYTMNVTSTVDMVAKQLVCSSAAEKSLQNLLTAAQLSTYRCACCKDACASCVGSLPLDDLATGGAASTAISGKMGELTGATKATQLFSSSSFNGDFVSNVWKEATKYFTAVCLPKCSTPEDFRLAANASSTRSYTFRPSPDVPWRKAWDVLATNANADPMIRTTINEKFTFDALPKSQCPYEDRYCVPFPGVTFKELSTGYCTFEMATAVVASIGKSASSAYEQLGANNVADSAEGSFGDAVGDLMKSLDALTIVCFLSLVIGLVFLILLRFLVGIVVWSAIWGVLFVFVAAGGFMFVRSTQCKGASIFASGKNMGTAAMVAASSAAMGDGVSEAMTGNGKDYRGAQRQTQSGRSCQAWNALSPHNHTTTPSVALYNKSGLTENFCRNPESAPTIWCFTTDPEMRWELCSPIGVLRPECPQGFVVATELYRKMLEVVAYITWGFAFLWLVLVLCLCKQIRLAIGINKVAATFVIQCRTILFVPIVQIFIGVSWFFIWCACASFLLSQVPAAYTPTTAFETYAIAYGTSDTPGKCTDKPTVGFTWKYEGNVLSTNDPCSGNLGDITGITPKCWKCAPPRYAFDVGFAVQLFAYLWNAAFLIALGQCTIAGAVGVWFFAPHDRKTKEKAVRTGLYNCFRYHAGSLAFGSFILALVQFIRYFCKYLEAQAKSQKNKVMVMVMKILQCCLWCIEKCIKFLNKNAYIQIALIGKNFCTSAKNAASLWARNFARFGVVAALGSIIHFLGFVFIMSATCIVGYFILQGLHPEITPVVPILCYMAISYLVAVLYMNVFTLAVDTILHCFIATEEMGSGNNDEFVDKSLLKFLADNGASKKEKDKDCAKPAWAGEPGGVP